MRYLPTILALVLAAPAAAQTAMYRGDASHTGVYASTSGEFGGIRWRVQTDGPVRSSPAVAAGIVYVGSSDGHLYALDAATGAGRWRFDAGSPVTSSPAVVNGLVIVGARNGRWVALNARTGTVRWRLAAGPDLPLPWGHESGDRWTSSPAVTGGLALLGGGDGVLRAVDAATGRVRWQARTAGRMRSSPAVGGGLVVVGDVQGVVYAFDLATGAQRWQHETEGHTLGSDTFGYDRRTIQSSAAIMDGRVFIGARDGFLYALDLATGARLWRADHRRSWVNTSPAVEAGRVYAGSSDGQFVQAVDAATGTELWRTTTALTWASPALSGSLLYAVDGRGFVSALDKGTGAVRWKWSAADGVFSSPVVEGGLLYVGSDDGGIYALDVSARRTLRRAVYWDSTYTRASLVSGSVAVRTWFTGQNYELIDRTALPRFLSERIADQVPSVVVFATDFVPPEVASAGDAPALLRRYLDAGGTVVWPGVPPLLWPRDSATGRRDLRHIGREAAARLLGVTFERSLFDREGSSVVTPAGRRLGMTPNFLSSWAADASSVSAVLAMDEMGLAPAWVRTYGGPAGTGFISIPSVPDGTGGVRNLLVLQLAAELRPTS